MALQYALAGRDRNIVALLDAELGMPGVGDQHARLHALGDGKHVAKEKFLGRERAAGNPEGDNMHLRHGLGCLEFAERRPEHAHAYGEQQEPESQGGARLETLMAIRMILVGFLLAVVVGEEHHEIRDKIRQ